MTADEPLGQRAERLARCMDAIARQSTIYNGLDRINAKDAAATLRALSAANAQLERERDAAREALRRIAGISNECTWHASTRKLAGEMQDIIRAALATPALRAGTHVVVPRKLLTEAHACMRATGWQLAPAGEIDDDGVLQLAVAEIEDQFRNLLAAAPEEPSDGR